MIESDSESYLAFESGAARTKTALVAPLHDGHHVCASVSTRSPEGAGVTSALDAGMAELERITGWTLHDSPTADGPRMVRTETPNSDRSVAIFAVTEKELGELSQQLNARGYVGITTTFALTAATDSPTGISVPDLRSRPLDCVVVYAFNKDDASALAALVRLSGAPGETSVIFIGPQIACEVFTTSLPSHPNVAHLRLDKAELRELSSAALDAALLGDHPTNGERISRLMASLIHASVCMVDVGGGTAKTSYAPRPEPKPSRTLRGFFGGGPSAGIPGILLSAQLDEIKRWLPFDISDGALKDSLWTRSALKPDVAQTPQQLMLDQALARVCGRRSTNAEVGADFLVGTGAVATYPRLGQSVLTLLDIAQPVTPCRILLDPANLLMRLPGLAAVNGDMALSVLKHDALVNVGVCLSVTGKAKPGETVAEIEVSRSRDSSDDEDKALYTIRRGSITVIPLSGADDAAVRLTTARRQSFGIEMRERAWASPSAEIPTSESGGIAGGLVGLIIDARGRPIEFPADETTRQARLIEWMVALDAFDATLFSSLDRW